MFKPGKSGNPNGRPLGSGNHYSLADLHKALDKAAVKHGGVTLLEHLANKAYKNNKLAIMLMKKMLPDLKTLSMTNQTESYGYATMSPSEAAAAMDEATNMVKARRQEGKKKKKRK